MSNSCNFNTSCYDPESTLCSDNQLCYDFIIKRHDNVPEFKVEVQDCDEPINLTNLVAEASMWSESKLKANITESQATIQFADNIGFDQILEGSIIQAGLGRNFERMLVVGFDENTKTVQVLRGKSQTQPFAWKKGTPLRLMRFLSQPAMTEMILEDVSQIDGTTKQDVLTHSYLIYQWKPEDTCLAGCFYFEFKLIKMLDMEDIPVLSPSNTPSYYPCDLGTGVKWIRRFPVNKQGFIIQVYNSPTGE
jgi:hypothetical protein